ncbi:hypothetical protein FRB94_014517 [Tulasnella sp. JGI-2019a]|nr:hypothetical protein FRB94_014517 [Tulasnella sp. JGI-2019a]KAG9011674.1 hypothetical protein FRB93_002735 [Tulasnella sp. JGI-2019a]KAG9038756.1 hypothetical protein FRB95_014305 [Tulasnella sp. JGI-2019a]
MIKSLYTLHAVVKIRPRRPSHIISLQILHTEGKVAQAEIALGARPIDGQANDELIRLLSNVCNVRKSDVDITTGVSSKNKILTIQAFHDPFAALQMITKEN